MELKYRGGNILGGEYLGGWVKYRSKDKGGRHLEGLGDRLEQVHGGFVGRRCRVDKYQGVFLDGRFEDFLGGFLREFLDERSG